ncbi:MAG: hypothetical protein ACLRFL_02790 [Clostridia bacterium]
MSKLSDLVQDYNIVDLDLEWIFNEMSDTLLKAFDSETSYDMRTREQMELDLEHSSYDLIKGKDNEWYPKIIMNIIIKDYDWMLRRVIENSAVHFELSLTPFTCGLDRDISPRGIYNGYDGELTIAWRKMLNKLYPEVWKDSFEKYIKRVKEIKLLHSKIKYDEEVNVANFEYNQELDDMYKYE